MPGSSHRQYWPCLVGCGVAPGPAAEPANSLIAAGSSDGIHLVDPETGDDVLVPNTEGAWEVAWSFDGRRLAFSRGVKSDTYTIRPDGSERRLVLHNAWSLTWSPDGERLAVIRSLCDAYVTECAEGFGAMDLYTVALDGGDVRRLTFDATDLAAQSWSPDGKWISYVSELDWAVTLVHPDGSARHRLGTATGLFSLAWSPDGSKLLGDTLESGFGLTVLDSRSGTFRDLTRRAIDEHSPVWSPDGEQIAFLATNTPCSGECKAGEWWESMELWVMDADGVNRRRLTTGGYRPPAWGPGIE